MAGVARSRSLVEARATLLGLWGDKDDVHMALIEEPSARIAVFTLPCPDGKFPSVGVSHPPAIRLERAIRDLYGFKPTGAADTRPWLDLGFWGVIQPLGANKKSRKAQEALCLPPRRGRGSASDPGRAGTCRHHRARTFPLHRQWRGGGAARGAARLCAQGHRVADGGRQHRQGRAACRAHLGRLDRRLCLRLRARRRGRASGRSSRARRLSPRADGRA